MVSFLLERLENAPVIRGTCTLAVELILILTALQAVCDIEVMLKFIIFRNFLD